jgi:hypothetical protein
MSAVQLDLVAWLTERAAEAEREKLHRTAGYCAGRTKAGALCTSQGRFLVDGEPGWLRYCALHRNARERALRKP